MAFIGCCSLFPSFLFESTFFPPRSAIDTSGCHSSGDWPIRSLPIWSDPISVIQGLAGDLPSMQWPVPVFYYIGYLYRANGAFPPPHLWTFFTGQPRSTKSTLYVTLHSYHRVTSLFDHTHGSPTYFGSPSRLRYSWCDLGLGPRGFDQPQIVDWRCINSHRNDQQSNGR